MVLVVDQVGAELGLLVYNLEVAQEGEAMVQVQEEQGLGPPLVGLPHRSLIDLMVNLRNQVVVQVVEEEAALLVLVLDFEDRYRIL